MSIGIYRITNKINGKSYIGQSIHIERRWEEHCKPSSSSLISKAIHKYGKINFLFEILEECQIEDLDLLEQYWIKKENTISPFGYNIALDTSSTHTTFYHFGIDIFENIVKDIKDGFKADYRDRTIWGDPMTNAIEGTTAVPRNIQVLKGNLNTFKPVPKATMTNARLRDYNTRGR